MKDEGPKKRRGRPAGSTKLRARPFVDKIAEMPGFGHLLNTAGKRPEACSGQVGQPGPGDPLAWYFVEGEAAAAGLALSLPEIKTAIKSRRRAAKPRKRKSSKG